MSNTIQAILKLKYLFYKKILPSLNENKTYFYGFFNTYKPVLNFSYIP